jgi:hypothetical protein
MLQGVLDHHNYFSLVLDLNSTLKTTQLQSILSPYRDAKQSSDATDFGRDAASGNAVVSENELCDFYERFKEALV